MRYLKNEFESYIKKWEQLFGEYKIPSWDELPMLDLYMDQVIVLMNRYLKTFVIKGDDDAQLITPPMINNYVKLKIMPAPIKKKYSKIHLAYLIIICSLKQTLSMAIIQKIIPFDLEEHQVIEIYKDFVLNQKKVLKFTIDQVDTIARPIAILRMRGVFV